jgi:DNA-binding NarL/FixJ family response regulator
MAKQIRIRVLSVDDHPLMREGISKIIDSQPDMAVVAGAATGRDAIEQFRQHKPDVILLDIRLPDMSGIDVLSTIRAEFSEARALMLTTAEGDAEIQRALQAGSRGYIFKRIAKRPHRGDPGSTCREQMYSAGSGVPLGPTHYRT